MKKVKIVLVDANDFNLKSLILKKNPNYSKDEKSLLKLKSNYIDYEKSKELMKDFVRVEEIESDKFMEKAVEYLGLDEHHYGDVKDCYEFETDYFQVIYKMPNEADNINKLKYNILGSSITFEKQLLYGNIILYKTYVSTEEGNTDYIDNCDINNLIDLIMNNEYHTGIYINSNNKFEQIYFNNELKIVDPFNRFAILPLNIMTNSNYGMKDHIYLKFNLFFIYNSNSEDKLNEPLSRLLHGFVKGDGIIYSSYSQNSFYDISVNNILDLLKVWNMISVQTNDLVGVDNGSGRKVEKTKYQILSSRIKNI